MSFTWTLRGRDRDECVWVGVDSEHHHHHRLQMYWQTSYHVPGIADVMTQKRLLTIFENLAARSNQERSREATNIYWKVAPIIDAVHNACISPPPEENNSIDEEMIPFQGRVPGR